MARIRVPLSLLRGTRGRLVLFQVGILTAAAVIADVSIYQLVMRPARASLDASLHEQLRAVEASLELDQGRVRYTAGEVPRVGSDGAAVETNVVERDGLVVAASSSQSLAAHYVASLSVEVINNQRAVEADADDNHGARRRIYAAALNIGDGPNQVPVAIVVSRSSSGLEDTSRRLLGALLAGSLLLPLLGGALAFWVSSRTLRAVGQIAAIARNLSEHDLHRRVDIEAPEDEIGELTHTFNLMLGRLESAFQSLHRFTADAAHELRAPLTVIQTQLEVALNRNRTPAEYQRALRGVLGHVTQLTRLAEQLLLVARADAGELRPQLVQIDVADFIHELAAGWRPVAASHGVRLRVDAPESGQLEADPALTKRVLDNLLDNAIRHAPEQSTVRLGARIDDEDWIFDVADAGPGVEEDQRTRIFDRFARADPSRTRDGTGAGLGLAISIAIARAHEGSLELVDRPGPGGTFRLKLPATARDH